MSIIFFYLSLDEAASIHELSGKLVRSILNVSGIFHNSWVVIAIPLVLIFIVFFRRFLLDLPQDTRQSFLIAGAIFIIGALGLEMLEGYVCCAQAENWQIINGLLIVVEEFLENFGIIVFIIALLSYTKLHLRLNEISLEFV